MKEQSTQLPAVAGDKRMVVATRVDQLAKGAMEQFREAGSFMAELSVALAVSDLREALTDEMMKPVVALMNTDLGFRTDRDPKLSPKDRDGNAMTPYSVEVVRECFIESKLRGFHACGNEWNIIQGRFYACKNGLKRKCEQWPMVTDLKIDLGLPRSAGDKGAIVPGKARWKKDGVADLIEAEIPVRVNGGMGADAILGKAQRKLYKLVHDRLAGIVTEDGEAGEDPAAASTGAGATRPEPHFDISKLKQAQAAPADASQAIPNAGAEPSQVTPQRRLADIVTGAGFTFVALKEWVEKTGWMPPAQIKNAHGFVDLSDADANRLCNAQGGLLDGLAKLKGGAK